MAEKKEKSIGSVKHVKKEMNRGAWTTEEDRKLAEAIEVHGAKRWKMIATTAGFFLFLMSLRCDQSQLWLQTVLNLSGFRLFFAGLNRCGKSCRLRWMNYLRPNIKRGNISDQEEDLILRLHKLLGNRLPN